MGQLLQGDDSQTSPLKVFFVVILSALIMLGWQIFYEVPNAQKKQGNSEEKVIESAKSVSPQEKKIEEIKLKELAEVFNSKDNVVDFENEYISGRLNLVGAMISRTYLKQYKNNLSEGAGVELLAPRNTKEAKYFSFGWFSDYDSEDIPNVKTKWSHDEHDILSSDGVTLKWTNKKNVTFFINLKLDHKYMLTVTKWIVNKGKDNFQVNSFTKIKKDITALIKDSTSYEGPIVIYENALQEISYDKLKKNKSFEYIENDKKCIPGQHNWTGISDKYWLSAILFDCKSARNISLKFESQNDRKYIQSSVLEDKVTAEPGEKSNTNISHIYIGPKDIGVLDQYSLKYAIKLFDKSIDFGFFYFLTKPILLMLRMINNFVHNYGFAIVLLTVLIRLLLLPLGNKSYRMMNKMKALQPKLDQLKGKFGDDKMALNRAMLDLYKEEKVNPLATFIPILIQIPIFFALYKVLYVSIEVRHSPFVLWITDLSVSDPTSLFNLFGLLPFGVPGFLQIGVLPILMGITMWLQQVLSYSGPTNEYSKIMKYMPIAFTFLFAGFPAGLMIYWIVNNIFSIANQYLVSKK